MHRFLSALILFLALLVGSCVVIVQSGSVEEIDPATAGAVSLRVPVKAFLQNGDVVVFENGATVSSSAILGPGYRHSLNRKEASFVEEVAMDSIIGIEAFKGGVDPLATAGATVLGTALGVFGGAALAVAIFGSCPTFYASPEQGAVLQAEAFSYSIASQLEAKDLDLLHINPDPDGVVRLELRNEALETHYINHLNLVAVEHAPGVHVVPDEEGRLLGTRAPEAPLAAEDRDGRSVLSDVVAIDDLAFSSTDRRIRAATTEDSRDHLDLVFPRPASETAVVLLDLRNSLLNTVLYYDLMLGTTGVQALNWWGGSLENIGSAFEMARWYVETLGLTVEVPTDDGWETVARVPDAGPIAWKEVGVEIPVPGSGPVRVRLSFLADDWRIDKVSLASLTGGLTSVQLPIHRVVTPDGMGGLEAASLLGSPDEDYLITYPGATAVLEFLPTPPSPGRAATFLLATQGYYVEWVRPEWIRKALQVTPFEAGPGSVETLLARWLEKKGSFEDAFFGSKIPVR